MGGREGLDYFSIGTYIMVKVTTSLRICHHDSSLEHLLLDILVACSCLDPLSN